MYTIRNNSFNKTFLCSRVLKLIANLFLKFSRTKLNFKTTRKVYRFKFCFLSRLSQKAKDVVFVFNFRQNNENIT